MNIELMAWTSLVAGLSTFIAVKALSWMPMSVRLMIWLLGVSLMGFAMVYMVSAYDPKMIRQATAVASWIMLVTRIAVPILAIYVILKWSNKSICAIVVASLFTSACGNQIEDNPKILSLTIGMLLFSTIWMLADTGIAIMGEHKDGDESKKDTVSTAAG